MREIVAYIVYLGVSPRVENSVWHLVESDDSLNKRRLQTNWIPIREGWVTFLLFFFTQKSKASNDSETYIPMARVKGKLMTCFWIDGSQEGFGLSELSERGPLHWEIES